MEAAAGVQGVVPVAHTPQQETRDSERKASCMMLGPLFARTQSFRSRFCLEEVSGALGDLGTLVPLLAACGKIGSVRIGPAIFWMGIFNIASAFQWDLPMPVQPMKSIAAVAISDGMSPGAFAAAGILTGFVVLLLGSTHMIELFNSIVPRCVVAGMQVGLGMRMAATGCSSWQEVGWADDVDCKLTSLFCLTLSVVLILRTRLPTALIVFSIGAVLAVIDMESQGSSVRFEPMTFQVTLPTAAEWLDGLVRGALPQLPLTTLNSVVSVCALSRELFGEKREATRSSVATSVGIMNIVGCWFGGMPSCHGAGGLAGQHLFGARGGMSILMLGITKVVLALAFGDGLDHAIASFPSTVLGVLLLFAGVELASVGLRSMSRPQLDERDLLPCFVTVGAYLGTKNMAFGVAAGLLAAAVQRWHGRCGSSEVSQPDKLGAVKDPQTPGGSV